jgi:aminoglycoside/choline kinase family phosphotransferase
LGLRVPEIFKVDLDQGWAILEDFGDQDADEHLMSVVPARRNRIILDALRPLQLLARTHPLKLPSFNPPLDGGRLRWELAGFELWFVRQRLRRKPTAEVGRWLDRVTTVVGDHPVRICHRDYHLNNLFILDRGEVGVIDFQDLTIGPDTYDIVSLLGERAAPKALAADDLETARISWAERTSAAPGWRDRWPWVRLQRGLKAIGTFARLSASGADAYDAWLRSLCGDLAADLDAVAAPSVMFDLLCSESVAGDAPPGI